MNALLIGGALIGIIGLALFSRLLGLGEEARIVNEDHALAVGEEIDGSFEAIDVAVDRAGYAALLRDADGRILLIRAHGGHFVGRILGHPFKAQLNRDMLTLEPDDPMFGPVTLKLGMAASIWASRLRMTGKIDHG